MATISLIVEQDVSDMFHVYTNLVRAASLEDTFHQGDLADAFQHMVVCDRMLPLFGIIEDGHLHPVFRVPADVSGDGAVVLIDNSPDEGDIFPLGGLVEEL